MSLTELGVDLLQVSNIRLQIRMLLDQGFQIFDRFSKLGPIDSSLTSLQDHRLGWDHGALFSFCPQQGDDLG